MSVSFLKIDNERIFIYCRRKRKMIKNMIIESAAPKHEQGWRKLWALYCADAIKEDVTEATWQRIIDPSSSIGAIVAMIDDQVVGFLTYVEHDGTWETKKICYVEDLYVDKMYRGDKLGIGFLLAESLLERLKKGEWARIYAITHSENLVAQRLYKRFARGEPYMRYILHSTFK